nr:DUF4097 family beta strand repeat protein [Bacteroidota bacterium]
MKNLKNILLSALIISGSWLFAQEGTSQKLVVPLSKPGEKGTLTIGLVNGSINVTGYSGNEIIIEASEQKDDDMVKITTGSDYFTPDVRTRTYPRARTLWNEGDEGDEEKKDNINRSTEGMKKIGANSFQISAEEKNNNVEVESDSWRNSLKLDVKVPKNFCLKLSTVNNGVLTIENVEGTLELDNVNGPINITNISGSALINTVNGSIKAEFSKVEKDAPMSFSTLNGDVELVIPASTKATLKMKTDMGEIFTDFEMDIKQNNPKIDKESNKGTYKVSLTKWVLGDINGGGPEFTFQSMHGDFFIRKK